MRLDFLHPEFHWGLNSTVRLGVRHPEIWEEVFVHETGNDKPIAKGKIVGYKVMLYDDIRLADIEYQHDPETTHYEGLNKAMTRAYGDKITGGSIVTIIYFELYEEL